MISFSNEDQNAGASRRRRRRAPVAMGLFVGVLATLIVVLAVMAVSRSFTDRLPPLTRADYEAAVARWKARGPANYDCDIAVEGLRAGKIHVEVRDGEVTAMTRDGVAPRQRRTWYAWSIEGQLETIGDELDKQDDAAAGFGAPPGSGVHYQALFDPELGYPKHYCRTIPGTQLNVDWRVTALRQAQ